jgi:hypothetical protein
LLSIYWALCIFFALSQSTCVMRRYWMFMYDLSLLYCVPAFCSYSHECSLCPLLHCQVVVAKWIHTLFPSSVEHKHSTTKDGVLSSLSKSWIDPRAHSDAWGNWFLSQYRSEAFWDRR